MWAIFPPFINQMFNQKRSFTNIFNKSLKEFIKQERIGVGEYGQVYRCRDPKNDQVLAMKKIQINKVSQGFPCNVLREVGALRQIQHPNIVALKYIVLEEKSIYLLSQHADVDLKQYIASNKEGIKPEKIKMFLYSILQGVAECHSKRILHRDLKTANILINNDGTLKIGDFGLARKYQDPSRPYSQQIVTMWYRAPELILGVRQYSTSVDIWSVGSIFAQMVTREVFFRGDSQSDQLYRIFKVLGTPTEKQWPGVLEKLKVYNANFAFWSENNLGNVMKKYNLDPRGIDLMEKLLKYDPNARISAKQALSHPYFNDLKQQ